MLEFRPRNRTDLIVLHGSKAKSLEAMRVAARTAGLLEIGYHYVVDENAEVHNIRPHQSVGAHTPGWNHVSIGVCVIEDHSVPAIQERALLALLSYLQSLYGNALAVKGRHEIQRLAMPTLHMDMDAFRMAYQEFAVIQMHETPAPPEGVDGLSYQNRLVLEYLQRRGPITNLLALTVLGIGSLSKRISELRSAGYDITSEPGVGFHGNKYARYSLVGTVEDTADVG